MELYVDGINKSSYTIDFWLGVESSVESLANIYKLEFYSGFIACDSPY